MRKLLAALILVLTAGAIWWYASPIWTLHAMRDAAKAHDAARLSAYVDYPALREDLKSDLRRSMIASTGRHPDDPGAKLGAVIAMAFMGPLVDAAVSPDGVEAMFTAEKAGKSVPVSAGDHPIIERDGIDTFRVHGDNRAKGSLVFHRYGLGWKLAGVDLPQPSGG